jgi:hypothetical protein
MSIISEPYVFIDCPLKETNASGSLGVQTMTIWMFNIQRAGRRFYPSELRSETFRNGIFMQNAGVHEFLKQSHACLSARTRTAVSLKIFKQRLQANGILPLRLSSGSYDERGIQ